MRLGVLDRLEELVHVLEAAIPVLLDRVQHDRLDRRRNVGVHRRRLGRLLGQVRDQHLAEAVAGEGHAAGEQLVHHDAERVHVAAVIDVALALALLGAHVRRRADDEAGARLVRRGAAIAGQLGDAEVENLGEVLVVAARDEKNILGLEIAVDDALGV